MAITVIQHASNSGTFSTTSGTLPITFASNITSGSCLVACISITSAPGAGACNVNSVTTNGSVENWTATLSSNPTTVQGVFEYTNIGTSGGTKIIDVNWSCGGATSTNQFAIIVDTYETSTLLSTDKTSSNNQGAGIGTWTSNNTATLSSSSEIAFGVTGQSDGTTLSVTGPSSPWVNSSVLNVTYNVSGSPFKFYQISGYNILSSNTGLAYSGSTAGFSGNYSAVTGITTIQSTLGFLNVNRSQFRVNTSINPIISSAARNLIMSVASVEGVDAFNNFYPEGVGVGGSLGLINLSPSKDLLAVYGNPHT